MVKFFRFLPKTGSRSQVFYNKAVLNTFKKFTAEQIFESLFLSNVASIIPKILRKSPVQAFSCELYQILHGTFFAKYLWAAASTKYPFVR